MYALTQLTFSDRDASSVHQKQSVAGCAELLVLEWTEASTTSCGDLEGLRARLAEVFSERDLVDLTASIGLMNALTRLRIALGEKV